MRSPRLSAGGLRFLDLPVPAVGLSLPSEDRRACWTAVQTTTGLPRFAPASYDRGGCFLYPGVLVSQRDRQTTSHLDRVSPARCLDPLIAVLVNHRIPATSSYGASSKIHSRSPVRSFPSPVRLDGSGSPWTSPLCFRTSCYQGPCVGWELAWTLARIVATSHDHSSWNDFASHE